MMDMNADSENLPAREETVLIVDDQPENLAVLVRLLQPLYKVRAARSGEQALKAVRVEPKPDLVLLDIMMPEMDGYTVLKKLKENPETQDIPVIFATALGAEEDEQRGLELGAVDYLNKPIKHSILLARVHTHLMLRRQYAELKVLNSNLDVLVRQKTEQVRETLASLATAHERLKNSFVSTVQAFSGMLELREKKIVGHSRRVAKNARKIADYLNLSSDEAQNILLAGLVHDIGKIGLPDYLFIKPFEALSPEERQELMQHPQRGADLLAGLDQFGNVVKLIRCHYERYDGTGYPDGLQGEDIPLGARILAIANDYDTLMGGQLLNKKLTRSAAMSYLMANAGKRYDPRLVDIFFRIKTNALMLKPEQEEADSTDAPDGRRGRKLRKIARWLSVSALKPGMVLNQPIALSKDMLLLSEGYVLTEGLIEQIRTIEAHRSTPFPLIEVIVREV